jgi:hypothetical protein
MRKRGNKMDSEMMNTPLLRQEDRERLACNQLKEIETGKVKAVPLIDLIMPLIENMSEEELRDLYKELKNK